MMMMMMTTAQVRGHICRSEVICTGQKSYAQVRGHICRSEVICTGQKSYAQIRSRMRRSEVMLNVNVRHTYWAPLNPVTEALHAVELTVICTSQIHSNILQDRGHRYMPRLATCHLHNAQVIHSRSLVMSQVACTLRKSCITGQRLLHWLSLLICRSSSYRSNPVKGQGIKDMHNYIVFETLDRIKLTHPQEQTPPHSTSNHHHVWAVKRGWNRHEQNIIQMRLEQTWTKYYTNEAGTDMNKILYKWGWNRHEQNIIQMRLEQTWTKYYTNEVATDRNKIYKLMENKGGTIWYWYALAGTDRNKYTNEAGTGMNKIYNVFDLHYSIYATCTMYKHWRYYNRR